MRDTLTLFLITVFAIAALIHPWLGIMSWTVVGIMNPHRYTWLAAEWPLAAAIAVATLLGMIFTRDRIRPLVAPATVALVAFMLWMCVTLPYSLYPDDSLDMWKKVMKIDFMIVVALAVLHLRRHVMALAWVLVGSIGFYGFKGGIFTIAGGGVDRVWGPPSSFIEGNNELALALIMTIPLMRFLQMQTLSRWMRHGLTVLMLLSAIAALGSQSRGALLAIVAMAVVLWWRGRQKLVLGVFIGLVAWGLLTFMPEQWGARMSTIAEYQEDGSAMGRVNAWWMAWNLAKDRVFGGGFTIYEPDIFARYAPVPGDIHAAHSIYFQVLGEHGFIGLALFLLIWLLVWKSAGWLRSNAGKQAESQWAADLGAMSQASLAAYAVGGAFLSLAYFDLPYNLLVLVLVARRWVEEKAWEHDAAGAARAQPAPSLPSSPQS